MCPGHWEHMAQIPPDAVWVWKLSYRTTPWWGRLLFSPSLLLVSHSSVLKSRGLSNNPELGLSKRVCAKPSQDQGNCCCWGAEKHVCKPREHVRSGTLQMRKLKPKEALWLVDSTQMLSAKIGISPARLPAVPSPSPWTARAGLQEPPKDRDREKKKV